MSVRRFALALLCAALPAQGRSLDATLALAGDNRAALEQALREVPAAERAGLEFLLAHMPEQDARSLSAEFLLRNVQLAYAARGKAPWNKYAGGKDLSDELFHNFVLPYAQANETREDWRSDFAARFAPTVAECQTPGEAAHRLNQTIFNALNVHYSTGRARADQAPRESIAQHKASCTGLSILLADACRAVGVPARLISVRWPHKQGNHTWVEVWDGAAWRFCGADEPDPQGLDRGWFVGDAAQCQGKGAQHAIWAVSFAATGTRFQAGWAPRVELNGIDVTARYAKTAGQDTAQSADAALRAQFDRFFAATPEQQAKFEFDRNLDAELATKEGDARLRALAWQAYKAAPHQALREDYAQSRVRAGNHTSPYVAKEVGTKPAGGWGLVIAMHGGGGVRKEVNDQQWRHMQIYYKDHPEAGGYRYVALRAPTDEWNGFYTDYAYPLIIELIRQFAVCGEVDTDKVIAIGYSHGGYGAFAIGPKMPDLFAAVHASASAPTDGETSAVGLRHLRFSFLCGERDTAYGRAERCRGFIEQLAKLRGERTDIYPGQGKVLPGYGHGGLPDRDLLAELVPLRRGAWPTELTWELTDGTVTAHYWLRAETPAKGQRVDAKVASNRLELTLTGRDNATAVLDARVCDLRQPLTVVRGDKVEKVALTPSLRTLCLELVRRGDPGLVGTASVRL